MKAVVLDITDGEATVMTKSGDIIGVKDENYGIGQEIMIKESVGKNIIRFLPTIAAAAVLLLTIGIGSYVYMKPYGTVSLDVNPSVEYTINRFDRVLSVNGINDDGSDIVSYLDVKQLVNRNIETAIDKTIEQIEAEGYLSNEAENYVVVTAHTVTDTHTDELVDKLDKAVSRHENVRSIASKVSDEEIREAHEQGVSPGKKMMVDRLDDISDEKIDRDKWNGKSVKEIVDEYDRKKTRKNEPQKDDGKTEAGDIPHWDKSGQQYSQDIVNERDENMEQKPSGEKTDEHKIENATENRPKDSEKPSYGKREENGEKPLGSNEPPADSTDNSYPYDKPVQDNGRSNEMNNPPVMQEGNNDFNDRPMFDGNNPGSQDGSEIPGNGHPDDGMADAPRNEGVGGERGGSAPPEGNGSFGEGDRR